MSRGHYGTIDEKQNRGRSQNDGEPEENWRGSDEFKFEPSQNNVIGRGAADEGGGGGGEIGKRGRKISPEDGKEG